MEGAKVPSRKSCDLCYRRKMKCDGNKPRCLHCVTYENDCTYTAPSRPYARHSRRNSQRYEATVDISQDRLSRLEYLVQRMDRRLDGIERTGRDDRTLQPGTSNANAIPTSLRTTEHREHNHDSHSQESWILPPLDRVLPVVQSYNKNLNSVLPLFHADTPLQLVHDCYSVTPSQRDPAKWAAVNVLLALARRFNIAESHHLPSLTTFLSRVEPALSAIIFGETQLLTIQILVGMGMLLKDSQDIKPALVLVATIIRLAHTIGLHDKLCSSNMSASDTKQRANVFWLAYILDKDLSMHAKQPSIQNDEDIHLDLPSPIVRLQLGENHNVFSADDTIGIITTKDGAVRMDYFTTRIQLATISGGVFDYIHSTRSQKRSPEERSHALHSVACALEQWKASIPPEFGPEVGTKTVAPEMLQFLLALHATSMACTTMIQQAHAWDAAWVASIQKYGRQGTVPSLPQNWEVLVGEARGFLILFGTFRNMDRWAFWPIRCSFTTAVMLLIANSMHRPWHEDYSLDQYLVESGMRTIDMMGKETGDDKVLSFQVICSELHERVERRRAGLARSVEVEHSIWLPEHT